MSVAVAVVLLAVCLVLCALLVSAELQHAQATAATTTTQCPVPHPVILMPGIGGSILETYLDIPDQVALPHSYCKRQTDDWTRVWISLKDMTPGPEQCYVYYMTPEWDNATQSMVDQEGISIRVPEFGGVYAVDVLDPSFPMKIETKYYHDMIETLLDNGYVEGTNLFGAPFDWRYFATDELVDQLKQLCETAYDTTGLPVTFVAHSMGGPYSFRFLQKMTDDWKAKYIYNWVTVSSPWVGSVLAVEGLLHGYSFGMPVPPVNFRIAERNMPSIYSLLPIPEVWLDQTMVITPTANYTPMQYEELWAAAGIEHGWDLTQQALAQDYEQDFTYPGEFPLLCVYATGTDTVQTMIFERDNGSFDDYPDKVYGDGDGTVNVESLAYLCNEWSQQGKNVTTHTVAGEDHVGLLGNDETIAWVLQWACN